MIKILILGLFIISLASALDISGDTDVIGVNINPVLETFNNNTASVNTSQFADIWITAEGNKDDVSDILASEITNDIFRTIVNQTFDNITVDENVSAQFYYGNGSQLEISSADIIDDGTYRLQDNFTFKQGKNLVLSGGAFEFNYSDTVGGSIFTSSFGNWVFDLTSSAGDLPFFDFRPKSTLFGFLTRDHTGATSTGYTNRCHVNAATDYENIVVSAVCATFGLVIDDDNQVGIGKVPVHALDVVGAGFFTGNVQTDGAVVAVGDVHGMDIILSNRLLPTLDGIVNIGTSDRRINDMFIKDNIWSNGSASFDGDLKVKNNFNQSGGNATINNIYGYITGNDVGVISVDEDIYSNVSNVTSGLINGFGFNESGLGELVVQIEGVYDLTSGWSFSGTANQEYHISIGINFVRQMDCHGERVIGTGGDVGNAGTTPCAKQLVVGDTINLMVENVDSGGDPTITDIGLGARRLSDIL